MSEMKLGDVPISTLNDTDNLIFAEGENIRQYGYGEVKKDILGSESLYDESLSVKEAINKNNASLSDKMQLYIGETLPATREKNTLYFKVTDTINNGTTDNITVSPTMGIKIV